MKNIVKYIRMQNRDFEDWRNWQKVRNEQPRLNKKYWQYRRNDSQNRSRSASAKQRVTTLAGSRSNNRNNNHYIVFLGPPLSNHTGSKNWTIML